MIKSIKTGTSSFSWATSLLPSDRGADARTEVTLLIIMLEIQIWNIEVILFFFCLNFCCFSDKRLVFRVFFMFSAASPLCLTKA